MGSWAVSHKFDKRGAELADGHYSRRTPGSPQFMPPGDTFVIVRDNGVFGWWRPLPRSGIKAMNGLDGWTCSIFRLVDGADGEASALILEAERLLAADSSKGPCGPDGLLTYVWPAKIKSVNPGFCFKQAGYHSAGRRHACCKHMKRWSADGKKLLLHKPWDRAGSPTGEATRGGDDADGQG